MTAAAATTNVPSLTEHTWVIADTHFGHNNIVKHCDRPVDHDALMLRRWKELVAPNDVVLHLGDIAWRRAPHHLLEEVIKLPGRVYFIRGNHDRRRELVTLQEGGWTDVGHRVRWAGPGGLMLLTHYPEANGSWRTNVHGHIHNNGWNPDLYPPRDRRNVSVEVTDYGPVRLGDVLAGRAGELQCPA